VKIALSMPRTGKRLPIGARSLAVLLLLLTVVWFGSLEYRKLIKPDEGRYAEIAREMAVSGDWVTPRLNDLKYFEKPPLQYWVTAATMRVFGTSQWQARLWPALSGFGAILLLAFTLARIQGAGAGLYGAAALASSVLWVYMGHFSTLDMGLSATMSMSFCGLLLAAQAHEEGSRRNQHLAMLLAWAGMALAVLSKGLIGILLPGGAVLLYVLIWRDWGLLLRLRWLTGLALFALLCVPWFVLINQRNPEFAQFFFIHEHIDRFLTPTHRRTGPVWYFVPVLLGGLLPWTGFLPRALLRALRGHHDQQDASATRFSLRFSVVWVVLICAFFSASSSKLPSYILPVFPALAVLIGHELTRCSARHLMLQSLGLAVFALAGTFALMAPNLLTGEQNPADLVARYRIWLVVCMAGLCAGAVLAAWLAARQRHAAAILCLAVCAGLAGNASLLGHNELAPSTSAAHLAGELKAVIDPAAPFFSVGMYEHALSYYLARPLTLVDYRDELDFGLTQEPDKGINTLDAFSTRWNTLPQAYAIMTPGLFETLKKRRLPMRLLAEDRRRIVVARH